MCVGDIFYKIKEVDEQGWCTGVKDGRTGLYPENYAAVYWPRWAVMSFDILTMLKSCQLMSKLYYTVAPDDVKHTHVHKINVTYQHYKYSSVQHDCFSQ